jgi:hypothetical protein
VRSSSLAQPAKADIPSQEGLADRAIAALDELLIYLRNTGYRFVTPTPATHARVLARRPHLAMTIADILGWSLPFAPYSVDPSLERLLADADMLVDDGDGYVRSLIRVSTVQGHLFIHSAYPTTAEDSVFLGPDSYRFADLIREELSAIKIAPGQTILDIGTGAGVGAVVAADCCPRARVVMTDLNPRALDFASINARHARRAIEPRLGRDLAGYPQALDIAMANPPYIIDPAGRAYRDGGGMYGAEISLTMTRSALGALQPGGRFILYTGSAIIAGFDGLKSELEMLARGHELPLRYRELDPDVFGEELDNSGYEAVDRIAVVAAVFG